MRSACILACLALALGGCDKLTPNESVADTAGDLVDSTGDIGTDGTPSDTPGDTDASVDMVPDVIETEIIETACMGSLTHVKAPGERVVIDLCGYFESDPAGGAAARTITTPADLIAGPAAQGQMGDMLLETGTSRFVIQGVDRHATPCPYGGTIIDASWIGDGSATPDNFGEICFFLNLGRTVAPRTDGDIEVVLDGADGSAAVASFTSIDTLSDWISLAGTAEQYLGFAPNTPFIAEDKLDVTLTHYYVANPQTDELIYLTAARNDSGEAKYLLGGDLIDSGGVVQFMNPLSSTKGFGYETVAPEPLSFLAFTGPESTHAYVPSIGGFDEDQNIIPDNSYLAVSGVAAVILGSINPLELVLAGGKARDKPGSIKLEPGQVHVWERRIRVGPTLSAVTDAIIEQREQVHGVVNITVNDGMGQPVSGVDIVPIRTVSEFREQAESKLVSDGAGQASARLPLGEYTLVADSIDRTVSDAPSFTVTANGQNDVTVVLSAPGRLTGTVTDAATGNAIPAKITVMCDGPCPRQYRTEVRDINIDGWGSDVGAVFYLGVDGVLDEPLVPGDYELIVSRGTTWTTWPAGAAGDSPLESALPFTVPPGGGFDFTATIRKAVDTSEYISADFHVHGINSPDAPVDNHDRVRTFLGGGIDLLISTDHDSITDYAPFVRAIGAEGHIATMIGTELTTFDYGHFNSFPLTYNPDDLVGGAVDWAVDGDSPLHPTGVFQALNEFDGEQVIQVNHASGGYFSAIRPDIARRISRQDPTVFRMPEVERGEFGDTGLYVEGFTAIEVYNGYSQSKFWTIMNWWFAMVANGFIPAATACSDSHKMYKDPGGAPTSFVYMGSGSDTVQTFDPVRFVEATNGASLFGTSGPFVRYWAENPSGERVQVGETLDSGGAGETVTLHVEIQTPIWMTVNRVRLWGNVLDSDPGPGQFVSTPPATMDETTFQLDASHLMGPPDDPMGTPTRYVHEVTFDVSPTSDGFYMVVVDSSEAHSMFPAIWNRGVAPFAYTNPILVDVDGTGWDAPGAIPADAGEGGGRGPSRDLTPEDLEVLMDIARNHDH